MCQAIYHRTDSASIAPVTYLGKTNVSKGLDKYFNEMTDGEPFIIFLIGMNNVATPGGFQPTQLELSNSERNFQEQKRAFLNIPDANLNQYRGMFVVSQDGRIVDSDLDLAVLMGRFFEQHGDIPVYITKIGGPIFVEIETPFLD